jgi:hypothetical protein
LAKEVISSTICGKIDGKNIRNTCYADVAVRQLNHLICENIFDKTSRDLCIKQVAVQRAEYSICANIADSDHKDACYTAIAKNTKTPSICALASKVISGVYNADLCYTELAASLNDANVCLKIKDNNTMADCVTGIASSTPNEGFCANIVDEIKERQCYWQNALTQQSPDVCGNLPLSTKFEDYEGYNRDACIISVATSTNNPELCYGISEDENRDTCIQRTYPSAPNLDACLHLSERNDKYLCINQTAQLTGNIELCAEISTSFAPAIRDECFMYFGELNADLTTCNRVRDDAIKGECYGKVFIKTGDYNNCALLPPSGFQTEIPHKAADTCFNYVARELVEVEWCNFINYAMWHGYCNAGVAKVKQDTEASFNIRTYCADLEIGTARDYCFYKLAELTNDDDYCLDIDDIQTNIECGDAI